MQYFVCSGRGNISESVLNHCCAVFFSQSALVITLFWRFCMLLRSVFHEVPLSTFVDIFLCFFLHRCIVAGIVRNCSRIVFLVLTAYLYVCCDKLCCTTNVIAAMEEAPIWVHLGVNVQNREKAFTSVLVWCKVYDCEHRAMCLLPLYSHGSNLFFPMFIYITLCNLLCLKAFFYLIHILLWLNQPFLLCYRHMPVFFCLVLL